MSRTNVLMIVAAACATIISLPTAAEASERERACDAGSTRTSRFQNGGSEHRACVVRKLEEFRFVQPKNADGDAALDVVQRHAQTLADFYAARSDRQLAFLDTGAFFTGTGTLGYALSAPAGVTTQSYWGYGALLPIILVQFNANEPTKDLFFAGRIGIDLLSDRYVLLRKRLNALKTLEPKRAGYTTLCNQAEEHLKDVGSWAAGDDKTAILPVVETVARRCRAQQANQAALDLTTVLAGAWKQDAARRYAVDVLRLDQLITERDGQLRTTPTEALTMLVSTPLRTLDTLISGENAQAALNTIKLQDALAGISLPLSDAGIPAPPTRLDEPLTVSAAAKARGGVTRPTRQALTVPETLQWLQQVTADLEAARAAQNEEIRLAGDIHSASQASQLTFTYDTASRRIQVTLQARGAQPPPTV